MEKYFSGKNSAENAKEKDAEFGKNVKEKLIEELVNIMESDILMNKMADYGTSNETREWNRSRKDKIETIKEIAGDSFSLIEEIAIERHKTKNK